MLASTVCAEMYDGTAPSHSAPGPGTGNLVVNGLKEGQYTAPTFEFIFPENVKPGDGLVPFDFWHLPFIAAGEGATTPSVLDPGVGPLEPAPW